MTYLHKTPLRAGLLAFAATSLTLSACATKQDRRGPPPERGERSERPAKSSGTFLQPIAVVFAGMDSNNDKTVSRAELQVGTTAEWATFDRNPSAAYFAQWSLKNLGSTDAMPTFMSFDKDFNGVVTEREFSEQLETSFERLDKNNDGRLERSEMLVAFNAREGQHSRQGGEQGGKKGGRGGGGRPPR